MAEKLVICDCLGTQKIDAAAIETGTGLKCSKVFTNLCEAQIADAATLIAEGNAIFACQQERGRFEDLAAELDCDAPGFVDIRDRAGWTDGSQDPRQVAAKMAALAAEAALSAPVEKSLDISSEGLCLILGPAAVALPAAEQLRDILSVTVLLDETDEIAPDRGYEVITGRLSRASGALGEFELHIDALRTVIAGGRGPVALSAPKDGAQTQCDIILDLRGGQPLFPAPQKRDGYLRADPKNPPGIAEAVLQASQLTGTFEKPLYVRLEPSLCAHSRAEKPACSNCLDICPTGAITSAGDHVAVDPMICAGCGACSALCPSGAISYDAPAVETLFRRIDTLARTYRKSGVGSPCLLVHDAEFGSEMIRLAARFGRGLPADVIPLEVVALSGFGHAEMLAALGAGFARVDLLLSPKTEREAPERETALTQAIAGQDRVRLLDPFDPDALSDALYGTAAPAPVAEPALPIGTRRQVARVAAKALRGSEETIALPDGAPYGAVLVDTDACTLCLSCVSLCPSGALGDNPDMPQLLFQEDACLQCGLCANICPEKAITLAPQLDLSDRALSQRILHEEEPFACVECGALFGVKSTIERITEKLAGKHSMFATSQAARMIQMCDNCRIQAQYHSENNPFAGGERPKIRTTDDELSKRRDH